MAARGSGKDIILQAFHWNLVKTQGTGTMDGRGISWLRLLKDLSGRIASAGFTVVYLPPLWRDDSAWEGGGRHGGGEGYFWHDFDLNSRYGTKEELKDLVQALHDKNIRVIVDLVTNHRDSSRMQNDIWPYPGTCWARGGVDEGGSFMDGRCDLNLSNPEVYGRIREAMNELMNDCGIDGWRWDYVWGYEVDEVISWIRHTAKEEYLSIGEYWQDSPYMTNDPMVKRYGPDEAERILGWARESSGCAFDIILKRQIQTAWPAYLKYGLNTRKNPEERASVVTFVDNHDMGASPFSPANGWGQQCWPCPPYYKSMAYSFILTMPGTPCVYWPDFFDWGHESEISGLIALRKRAGIVSSSEWIDLSDRYSGFAGIVLDQAGNESLALSIGSDYTGPGTGWNKGYEKRGEYSVWVRE